MECSVDEKFCLVKNIGDNGLNYKYDANQNNINKESEIVLPKKTLGVINKEEDLIQISRAEVELRWYEEFK